jgi:hypothetical protein
MIIYSFKQDKVQHLVLYCRYDVNCHAGCFLRTRRRIFMSLPWNTARRKLNDLIKRARLTQVSDSVCDQEQG